MIHIEGVHLLLQVQILGVEIPRGTKSRHDACPEHSLGNGGPSVFAPLPPQFQRGKTWQAGPRQVAEFIHVSTLSRGERFGSATLGGGSRKTRNSP